jgi:hypothetical protein
MWYGRPTKSTSPFEKKSKDFIEMSVHHIWHAIKMSLLLLANLAKCSSRSKQAADIWERGQKQMSTL